MKSNTMRAAAIHTFGGTEMLEVHDYPIPPLDGDEVLIKVHTAGVAVWDPYEISGGFQSMGGPARFPYIPGSDASGTIAAVGAAVRRFGEGDKVYATTFLNPKGGCYAEYVVINEDRVAPLPSGLDLEQAGPLAVDAITAMSGLDGALSVGAGDTLLLFGASGGIGHLALQFAKRIGATVFAVASGEDGTNLAQDLGADGATDGKSGDPVGEARSFAAEGFDAALVTAGGGTADELVRLVKSGGRVGWPYGVEPEPEIPAGVTGRGFHGQGAAGVLKRINRLIDSGPFRVNVARTFSLSDAVAALEALSSHYLGKLALAVNR